LSPRGRSFRARLSFRFTSAMAVAVIGMSVVTLGVLRVTLDRELDASILSVASIQASSLIDGPDGPMHFHEWDLSPEEAASVRELNRFAQVWTRTGESILRSQYMTGDLPLSQDALLSAASGELVWREQIFDGDPIRSLYYPLGRLGPSHEAHVLQVAAPLVGRNAMLRRSTVFLGGIGLIVVLGTLLGSWWLAGTVVRPVHDIIDQAEEIEAGSTSRISAYADTDEYTRLVKTLNTMLERLQRAYAGQRQFTADASHELRTPLTALRGELELALRRSRSGDEYREVLESSLEEVLRLARITEELLLLARVDSGGARLNLEESSLSEAAKIVCNRLAREAEARSITLNVIADVRGTGLFDPVLIHQVVSNLVGNALKFAPVGGDVRVTVTGDRDAIFLAVDDSGPGLGPDPGRVFERFFQADPSRSAAPARAGGSGLGLSIVAAIVAAHEGVVEAGSSDLGGASIRVSLLRVGPTLKALSGSTS
jgi:two-component system, OmpR family, sensor kinase